MDQQDAKATFDAVPAPSRESLERTPVTGAGVAVRENEGVDSAAGKDDASSSVIEIREKDLVKENQNQRVCRICQLNGKELIELGCMCRGELGFVHLQCAQAWFRVKGNRSCEICGETAVNITGIDYHAIPMEPSSANPTSNSPPPPRRYCNERPICWLIVICLAIAFILPWYFRVTVI